jgi:SAM-dependent methyltransferase
MNTQDKLLYESTEVWDQTMQTGQRNLAQAIIDFFPQEVTTALDVGCGDGKLTELIISATKCPIIGLDFSEEALSRCTFKTIQGDATNLPFNDGELDLVLTTDMLEHLPHDMEEIVWSQLFRVAKKWVLVAVPFREELLEATTKCHHCGHQYHVNWHMRSYDWPGLVSRCPDSFEVDKIILTGEPWLPFHPLETKLRRELLDEWSGWCNAVCPHCESPGSNPEITKPLPPLIASALGSVIYANKLTRPDFRSHSELLVIYRHKSICKMAGRHLIEANVIHSKTNEIVLDEMEVETTLIPYPSVARAVHAADEGFILQFPAYSTCDSLKIEATQNKQEISLSVEDGFGILFSGELTIDSKTKYVLSLPRKTICSYYGVLVRINTTASIKSIQFGDNQPVYLLQPAEALFSYYRLQFDRVSTYIQITTPFYFNNINLTSAHSEPPSWLQLLQQIEELAEVERDGLEVLNQNLAQAQNELQVQNQNLVQERDGLQANNHELRSEIYALNNRFEIRVINKFHRILKGTKRIFIK